MIVATVSLSGSLSGSLWGSLSGSLSGSLWGMTGSALAPFSSIPVISRAAEDSAPLSAFVWWLIPLFGFIGAIGYVIWVTKFQSKFENETHRSVGRFQKFQKSLEKNRTLREPDNASRTGDHGRTS